MRKIFLTFAMGAILVACDSQLDPNFELPKPESHFGKFSENKLINKEKPEASSSTLSADGTYTFVAKLGYSTQEQGEVSLELFELEKVVKDYNDFKGVSDFVLLPETHYEFVDGTFQKGDSSAEVQLKLKDYNKLEQGNYILPLVVVMDEKKLMHLVFINKDAQYVPLSENNKKPMPPGTYSCPNRTEPMKMVAYVETNDWDIRNMGQFILKESKKPVFDMVILFAANMNYDAKAGRRVLSFNDKLQPIVNDPEKYIKPLKDRGIKVLVDILPNHQGVGYYNFQNYEEALDFARQCKHYTDKLGIDGWDIDEEYANYSALPEKPEKGNQSLFWFMRAMKEVMPDKLLTLYDYGHYLDSYTADETGKKAVDYLDYSWANYGENHDSYAGLPNERYGKVSIEAAQGGLNTYNTPYRAQQNLQDCMGLLMIFNINGRDIKSGKAANALSEATKRFYGEECIFEGKYHKGPKD